MDIGTGEVLGLQELLTPSGGCPLARSAPGNEGFAAGLAADASQVSWCVSLSASREAELHCCFLAMS